MKFLLIALLTTFSLPALASSNVEWNCVVVGAGNIQIYVFKETKFRKLLSGAIDTAEGTVNLMALKMTIDVSAQLIDQNTISVLTDYEGYTDQFNLDINQKTQTVDVTQNYASGFKMDCEKLSIK